MNDKNQILEALGKLPELIESIKALIEESEKKDAFLAKMAETKVEAQMSDKGKQEIVDIVEETVKATPCAAPNVTESSKIIAYQVLNEIEGTISHAVEEKVKTTPITLEHHHTHTTTYELSRYAEESTKKWLLILTIVCGLLSTIIIFGIYWYTNSEYYWAKEYTELYLSKYTTDAERNLLKENTYPVGILPKKFSQDAEFVKAKIKQNKAVLKERRRQAKANGGKYRTNTPLER